VSLPHTAFVKSAQVGKRHERTDLIFKNFQQKVLIASVQRSKLTTQQIFFCFNILKTDVEKACGA
jgi:hypothetical protein